MTTSTVCSPCLRGTHKRCQAPDSCSCATCNAPEGFAWEDPPPRSRGGRGSQFLTPAVLEELRRNPDRWARVKRWEKRTSASSAAQRIRKGNQAGIDPKEFEARGAIIEEGKASVLYMRFVGSP